MSDHSPPDPTTTKGLSAVSSSQDKQKSVEQPQAIRSRLPKDDLPETTAQKPQTLNQPQEQKSHTDNRQTTIMLASATSGLKKRNLANYEEKLKVSSAVDEMNEAQIEMLIQLVTENSELEMGDEIELDFEDLPEKVQHILLLYVRADSQSARDPVSSNTNVARPRAPTDQKLPKPSKKKDVLDPDFQPDNRLSIQTEHAEGRTIRTRGAAEKDTPEARASALLALLDKDKGAAHTQVLRSLVTSVQKIEEDAQSTKAHVAHTREPIERVNEKYFGRKHRIRPHDRLTVDYLLELLNTAVSKRIPHNDFFDTMITALTHLRNGMLEKSEPAPRGDEDDQQLPSDSEVDKPSEEPPQDDLEAELELDQRGIYEGGRDGSVVYSAFPREYKGPVRDC